MPSCFRMNNRYLNLKLYNGKKLFLSAQEQPEKKKNRRKTISKSFLLVRFRYFSSTFIRTKNGKKNSLSMIKGPNVNRKKDKERFSSLIYKRIVRRILGILSRVRIILYLIGRLCEFLISYIVTKSCFGKHIY